ncbi:MAG: YbjQ family protein [Planctomycetaceae bacterium]|nr:YbjQ family protein [Planctomycetaceae bacterium]
MIIVNTDYVTGHTVVRTLGLVQGSTVRAKHVGRDIAANFKSIFGGEIRGYTELLNESRQQAVARMVETARKMGANAVVNVRFSTNAVMQGACELYCWGTAVVIE